MLNKLKEYVIISVASVYYTVFLLLVGAFLGETLLSSESKSTDNDYSYTITSETKDSTEPFNEVHLLGDGQIYEVVDVRYEDDNEVVIILHNVKYNRRRYCVFSGEDYYRWSMLVPGDTIQFVDDEVKSYIIQ